MTDREFLESQSRLVRQRLRQSAAALHEDLETHLGPLVREHPRASLAVGAATGLLVGSIAAPVAGTSRRGPIRGAMSFVRDTGVYALRYTLVRNLLASFSGDAEQPGAD